MHNILIKSRLYECKTGKEPFSETLFVCSEDKNNYYFKFNCQQKYSYPKHKEYNAPLYEGDIVEVMLSLENKNKYLEIEVNQYNAKYCVLIENKDGKGDISIEKLDKSLFCSLSFERQKDSRWIVYISLPKKQLSALGWRADTCYINAHRQDFDKSGKLRLYSLNPTLSDTFHCVDAFIKLHK